MRALQWFVTLGIFVLAGGPAAVGQTIVDEWASVKVPPAPTLQRVAVDPKTTALFVLDIIKQTCNAEKRPRCVASVPKIKTLLSEARRSGTTVIYATIPPVPVTDTVPDLAPQKDDPVIVSWVDKFTLGNKDTGLEKLLKEKGIKTLITVGTSSNGAVFFTASAAALRDFSVIVPVDGMSANGQNTYIDQSVVYNLSQAPIVSSKVTLTSIGLISFK